jgi:hypothetical protein
MNLLRTERLTSLFHECTKLRGAEPKEKKRISKTGGMIRPPCHKTYVKY